MGIFIQVGSLRRIFPNSSEYILEVERLFLDNEKR